MVNLHFSLLPRWRGAAPVERALLAGDERTGVCLMALEEGLDTGAVYGCREVPIGPDQTADELRSELVSLGTEMLVDMLAEGLPEPRAQEGEVTYAAKLQPEEHRLDWSRPAVQLHRVVRLGQAWTTFRGRRLKVLRSRLADGGHELAPGELAPDGLRVGTGQGALELVEVQPEGREPQAAAAWRNGARPEPGERLGP
jgi:methionyl-tRNA formyltransferase